MTLNKTKDRSGLEERLKARRNKLSEVKVEALGVEIAELDAALSAGKTEDLELYLQRKSGRLKERLERRKRAISERHAGGGAVDSEEEGCVISALVRPKLLLPICALLISKTLLPI